MKLRLEVENTKSVTAEALVKILTGNEEKPLMLLEIFEHHNRQMAALENTEYAPATVKRYDTTLEHTRSFISWKYNMPDIEIKSLSFDFVSDMEFWLKSVRKCTMGVEYCYSNG